LRDAVVARCGEAGAFPAPAVLLAADLDLPGRKAEYLHAVAGATLDGALDTTALRSQDPDRAVEAVQRITGLGPFSAELVVLRGAGTPDGLPRHEGRLDDEVARRYGPGRSLAEVSAAWRPYRTWAAVHLRALGERRARSAAAPS